MKNHNSKRARVSKFNKTNKPDKRARDNEFRGKLLIKGRHEVTQAIKAMQKIEVIYISEQVRGKFPEQIYQLAKDNDISIKVLENMAFKKRFADDAQGIVAITPPFEYCTLERLIEIACNKSGVVVALNKVEDPRNLGAIIRTVEASGCDGIIIPKHRSASITEGAIRTAQGATSFLPVARVTNLTDAINELKDSGFWVVGLDANAEKIHTQIVYNDKIVLVAGGENAGLGSRLEKACDDLVAIPLHGNTTSLNVSVSVGISLYEILRQKKFF